MTSAAEETKIGAEDDLAGEETPAVKHEYIAGEVFAKAEAGEAHVTVALNLASLLRNHVRSGLCRVYISDMKVRVEKADAFYYPDVFVTCDPADGRENLFKRNPTLVIEVLSESTAAFDRGAKFAHYRQLASLREYGAGRAQASIHRRLSPQCGGKLGPVPDNGRRAAGIRLPQLQLPVGFGVRRHRVRLRHFTQYPHSNRLPGAPVSGTGSENGCCTSTPRLEPHRK